MTESSHHVAFTKCMIFLRGRRQRTQPFGMCLFESRAGGCIDRKFQLWTPRLGYRRSSRLGPRLGHQLCQYMGKRSSKRIKNWNLSPINSNHPRGTLSEAGLGAAYYMGRISALRAYRLASNHIRPLHRHRQSDTSSVSAAP